MGSVGGTGLIGLTGMPTIGLIGVIGLIGLTGMPTIGLIGVIGLIGTPTIGVIGLMGLIGRPTIGLITGFGFDGRFTGVTMPLAAMPDPFFAWKLVPFRLFTGVTFRVVTVGPEFCVMRGTGLECPPPAFPPFAAPNAPPRPPAKATLANVPRISDATIHPSCFDERFMTSSPPGSLPLFLLLPGPNRSASSNPAKNEPNVTEHFFRIGPGERPDVSPPTGRPPECGTYFPVRAVLTSCRSYDQATQRELRATRKQQKRRRNSVLVPGAPHYSFSRRGGTRFVGSPHHKHQSENQSDESQGSARRLEKSQEERQVDLRPLGQDYSPT